MQKALRIMLALLFDRAVLDSRHTTSKLTMEKELIDNLERLKK